MRRRASRFDLRVSPSFLLFAGLLLAPAIVLQQNIIVKVLQSAVFLLLALLSVSRGRRRLIAGSMIFSATTILVNLFSPVGRVLATIGPLRITRGALSLGLFKATTLASLLYVSRICVRPTVRLPGAFGRYVSQALAYLNRLLARREGISRHDVVGRLDDLFESVLEDSPGRSIRDGRPARARSTVAGVSALTALLVVNWAALFLPFSALLGAG